MSSEALTPEILRGGEVEKRRFDPRVATPFVNKSISTLEAYATAEGMSWEQAHNYAAQNFGSLEQPSPEAQGLVGSPDSSGYYHNGLVDYPVYKADGAWMRMRATVQFSSGFKPGVT